MIEELRQIRHILEEEPGEEQVLGITTRLLEISQEISYLNGIYLLLIVLGEERV